MLLDTPICDFGWPAPDFSLLDLDGVAHSPSSAMGERGLLLVFMCNHCPYVKAIMERLVADTTTLAAQGVATLGIMSNDYHAYPADSPANMRRFAQKHGMRFPYLIDEDQAVAKAYGAVCTPDFFGFNTEGELQYRGRLDDARMGDASARTAELLNAMQQLAATGEGPQEQLPSMGCSIKWR